MTFVPQGAICATDQGLSLFVIKDFVTKAGQWSRQGPAVREDVTRA